MGEHWVAFDLESTGLKAKRDKILEVAAQEVNPKTLELLPLRFDAIVAHRFLPTMEQKVLDMHTKSGLLHDLTAARDKMLHTGGPINDGTWVTEEYLDHALLAFFQHVCATRGKIILLGNSVHFDRNFLEEHCPRTEDYLHHRHVDVSVFRTVWSAWVRRLDKGDVAHRARGDIEMSLAGARWAQGITDIAATHSNLLPPANFAKPV